MGFISNVNELVQPNYQYISTINSGSCTSVLKFKITNKNHFYAAKILDVQLVSEKINLREEEIVNLIEKKVKMMDSTRYIANIIHLDKYIHSRTLHIMIMDYCKYGSIETLINTKYRTGLSEKLVKKYVLKMVKILSQIHKIDIIHCNIKPSNIFLCDNRNKIKFGDIGLSCELNIKSLASIKLLAGSNLFLSPEILECRRGYSKESDVYALGITVLSMICAHNSAMNVPKVKDEYLFDSKSNLFAIYLRDEVFPQLNYPTSLYDFIFNTIDYDYATRYKLDQLRKHQYLKTLSPSLDEDDIQLPDTPSMMDQINNVINSNHSYQILYENNPEIYNEIKRCADKNDVNFFIYKKQFIHDDKNKSLHYQSLFNILTMLNHLTTFYFNNCGLDEEFAKVFSQSFENFPHIRSINLTDNDIGDQGVKCIFSSLKYTPELQKLNLNRTNFGDIGLKYLCENIEMVPFLVELSLEGNLISEEGVKELCGKLDHLPCLKQFKITSQNRGITGRSNIKYLKSKFPKLLIY